jgi:formylglycine-generating enzyme required for sulfatase activity
VARRTGADMITVANIRCAVLPRGPHAIGSRGPDRFASATEQPVHEITFHESVAIACDPVTEREYAPFAPEHVPAPADLPVVNVSWHDANAYCEWLRERTGQPFRLPSEAEWEIACRAGTDTPFSTGDGLPPAAANYLYNESGERIGPGCRTPVASYASNAWGLNDMHGNVAEWCADAWHPSHEGAQPDGSARADSSNDARVVRGGAWDLLPRLLRSASRDALAPATRRDNLGFRVAVTLSE